MLTIRNSQMEAFSRAATERFLHKLAAHLVEAAGVPKELAIGQARGALESSRVFNLISELDVAQFGVIICRYAGGFPLRTLPPDVQSGLLAYGVSGAERLRGLQTWAETA
jgi:hypothetical protein